MPTPLDSPASPPQIRIQATSRHAGRQVSCCLHLPAEWPYMACSTCLVALLVLQPFDPPSAMIAHTEASHSNQRSLHEIASNCLENHQDSLVSRDCGEACTEPVAPADPGASQLSRSILTCRNSFSASELRPANSRPQNRLIEVAPISTTF